MAETLELGDGRWRLLVAPALGGSLLACDLDGFRVLQPAPQAPETGRTAAQSCYFPLIPFSNRIENGRFRFNGHAIQLARNVAGSPHALHGHGWQAAWQVSESTRTSCALEYRHEPTPDWPWLYQGRQNIAIGGDALRLTLAVENLGTSAMPCGLGFHPYFPRSSDTRLEFAAAQVWDGKAASFPTAPVVVPAALDFRGGPRIADREGTDHCYEGWTRRATIGYESAARRLTLDGCAETAYAIVYVPADADYFCVEPVTHAVNAMNRANAAACGWWTLEPGACREIRMTIRQAAG